MILQFTKYCDIMTTREPRQPYKNSRQG